jgi:phosphatidylglycerophosphatase A
MSRPTFREILRSPALLLSSGFGSGLSPWGPGTAGSVFALLIFWLLVPYQPVTQLLCIAFIALVGFAAVRQVVRKNPKTSDPGWIVIDEWTGVWITLWGSPLTGESLLLGFALFRILDIFKPFPISSAERLPGALGIMADDIVAGILGMAVMHILLSPRFLLMIQG